MPTSSKPQKAIPSKAIDRLELVASRLEKIAAGGDNITVHIHGVGSAEEFCRSAAQLSSAASALRREESSRWTLYTNGGVDVAARDATTGLTWTLEPIAGRHQWLAAKKAASEIRLLGRTDWRLPTIREQLSVVDYERHHHALCSIFRVPASDWLWTSTKEAEAPESLAWGLYLLNGSAYRHGQGYRGLALAVCGPVPPASQ